MIVGRIIRTTFTSYRGGSWSFYRITSSSRYSRRRAASTTTTSRHSIYLAATFCFICLFSTCSCACITTDFAQRQPAPLRWRFLIASTTATIPLNKLYHCCAVVPIAAFHVPRRSLAARLGTCHCRSAVAIPRPYILEFRTRYTKTSCIVYIYIHDTYTIILGKQFSIVVQQNFINFSHNFAKFS